MRPAILYLEDGTLLRGHAIGADGSRAAELCFNTSMTGYQEILSDPSYCGQFVTMTYPHIGNVGCNPEDMESDRVYASGLVIRDLPRRVSSHRARESLGEFLTRQGVVAIAGVNTRLITRKLRDFGLMRAVITTEDLDEAALQAELAKFPGMQGLDLASTVTTAKRYKWDTGLWELGNPDPKPETHLHVVALDFGIKRNILRGLVNAGMSVTVVPASTTVDEIMSLRPDGVFLSNGPGDPEPVTYAIATAKGLIEKGIPLFGICLGHQILALASGATTRKMSFGHHGGNQPVKDLLTGKVEITSQNHGFEVDASTLPANLEATHISLFDGSLEGFRYTDRPVMAVQFHPEASPGPQDTMGLFARFADLIQANARI